jgi:hypothetical protein
MDCPVCDGRLTFRSSNPRFRGATTGRCGLCRTRFALAGGQLHAIEAGDRSRRQREVLAATVPPTPATHRDAPGAA